MKKHLSDLHNELKAQFIDAIIREVKVSNNKIKFLPYIKIAFSDESDDLYEEITDVEFLPDENICLCHNFITDMELQTQEYYTPFDQLSWEELFKIAERL